MWNVFHSLNIYLDVAKSEENQKPNERNDKSFQINETTNEHIDKEPKFIANANVLKKSDEG